MTEHESGPEDLKEGELEDYISKTALSPEHQKLLLGLIKEYPPLKARVINIYKVSQRGNKSQEGVLIESLESDLKGILEGER